MASSHSESKDSEEFESDSDSEVENGYQVVSELKKSNNLKSLEEEDKVLETLNEVQNIRQDESLDKMLIFLKKVTNEILKPSFRDITNLFSNGAIFFVDGDSLLLNIMGNVNYDPNNGGQLLHLIYMCERHLQLFSRKGGQFEVIFFNIWNQAWSDKQTLLLARSALMSHLRFNMSCKVHEFDSMWDLNFKRLLEECNCSFLLIDFEMLDTYCELFPHEDHMLSGLIFNVNVCYSLLGLYIACVDMNNVELTVSTLNAFYCIPGAALEHLLLRKLLDTIISRIEQRCKLSLMSTKTVEFPLIHMEGERDVRHIITVTSAAQFLKESGSSQPWEDLIRLFLLYSALLEVLPLKFRACAAIAAPTTIVAQFIVQLHKHMNRVLQTILHNNKNFYNFKAVSDLWHGNLFVFVVDYVAKQGTCEEIVLGSQTLTAYEKLLQEVDRLAEIPLMKFPVSVQRLMCREKANEENKEDISTEKTISSLAPLQELKQLVPTNCLLTFEFCKDVLPEKNSNKYNNVLSDYITRNSNFQEKYHWHSRKPITDQYDRIKDGIIKPKDAYQLRKYNAIRSKYAHFMSMYGCSIEGRLSSTKNIVCENGNSSKKKGTKIKKPGKHAQKIIEDNCRKRQAKTEEADKTSFNKFKATYKICKERGDYHAALNEGKLLESKVKTKHVLRSALVYMASILWSLWQDECRAVHVISKRSLQYAKELFLMIRRILKDFEGTTLNDKDAQLLGCYLWQMGLERIAQNWDLPEPSKSTTDQAHSIGMSWIDFQLLHLGPELERELGSKQDDRVEGFMPDEWQIKLFDCVDKRQSVLVVAPTSSGKTYASYYCMEKVLRESNDGVVVYVAPTKALVNQVAATIYARFKNKDMPDGKSVYGVLTRDYRTNALNSQILITVPECLELLLLSPRQHDWVKSLRYIIFDEIHCLAGQSGGFAWECGLLLIRCPFLALSATIDDPKSLHKWLQNMQNFKQEQDITNGCEKCQDSYKVNLVVYRDRHADLRKHVYCEDGQFHHVHPYVYLDRALIVKEGGISENISLSPEEVHQLYRAMECTYPQDLQVRELHPEIFFSTCTTGFISRNLVRDFEAELKKLFKKLASKDDTAVESILRQLSAVSAPLGGVSEMRFIEKNFICFVQRLQEQNMLPAIVFSYNRSLVVDFFRKATEYYDDVAQKYEDSKRESKSIGRKRSGEDEEMEERKPKGTRAGNVNEVDFRVSRARGRNKYQASLNLLYARSTHSSLIRGVGHTDEKVVEYIEHRLMGIGYKQTDLFPCGLSLGVGMHHGGMNAKERSAVEMLFRMQMLNLAFATGTLALGIHMPCKTVAIVGDSPHLNPLEYQQMSGRAGRRGFDTAGNVVFMGLNERKMRVLLTGKLPKMIGNFPLNITMVLRVLLMVNDITSDGTRSEEATRDALSRALTMLNSCLVYETYPELKLQMKHFFAFSTQLLMMQGLLDDKGAPQFFSGIITHLHYLEPGNLAFVYLFKSGALRKLCRPERDGRISKETEMNLVVVLSYLFAPHILHKRAHKNKYNNSKVVLPPLPPEIEKVLNMYNQEVMHIYDNYFKCVAEDCAKRMGNDETLPMSGVRIVPPEPFEPSTEGSMDLERYIVQNCESRVICSAFAALSGHTDRGLYSHYNMISNIRHQVFTDVKVMPIVELNTVYNGYAWDFYNHGISSAICDDNGLKQGEDFYFLKNFQLMLKVITTSLAELEPIDDDDKVFQTFCTVEQNFSYNFWKAYDTRL